MTGQQRPKDEAVIQQFGPMVYRLAFAQTRSQADADDVYQEVFLRYVEKAPVFHSGDHAKAWFLRVTINCCNDLWRSPWRRRSAPLTEDLPFETREELGLHQELLKLPKKYRTPPVLLGGHDHRRDRPSIGPEARRRAAAADPGQGHAPGTFRRGGSAACLSTRTIP